MTRDYPTDVDITASDEFRAVLAEVVKKADDAGVDVRGTWEFETQGSIHNWEIEIVELMREADE